MPSYLPSIVMPLCGMEVTEETAATDEHIRRLLLWESHEINFRCELMALDACLVPRADWPLIRRWARESLVSEVWGPPASLNAVVPSLPPDDEPFCWQSSNEHDWNVGLRYLVRFLDLLVQWDGCPGFLKEMRTKAREWTAEDFDLIQCEATRFYSLTFASRFGRLPIYPIPYIAS